MVQIIETGNPQGKLSEMLGMSLGQGIGNGLNTFFANRSLESVMKDKSLEGAPQSKKLQTLISALAPYGETGKNLLNQYLEVAKQEESEKFQSILQKAFSQNQEEGSNTDALDPVQQGIIAMKHPQFINAYQAAQKAQEPQRERERKTESGLSTAQGMKDRLKYVGSTKIPGQSSFLGGSLNRKAVQEREHFDFLAAEMASFLRDLDTKGQLPQGLYEQVIKTRLPNSELSERTNLGRIEGYEDLIRRYGGKKFTGKSKGSTPALTDKKQKFSFSNPNHKAKFDKLASQFGMDEQKIREVLEKEFELD
jgi:hypothetical protein